MFYFRTNVISHATITNFRFLLLLDGAHGSVVVKTLCYKPEGCEFETR
jgi:hypothetical protein